MERAKAILPRIFQDAPAAAGWRLDLIKAYWAEAVGPVLAANSEPIRVARDELVVRVRDEKWIGEFYPMRAQIVRLLQKELPSAAVSRVRLEIAQPQGPATGSRPRPGPARWPRRQGRRKK